MIKVVLQGISVWQIAGMPPQCLAPALTSNRLPCHLLREWQQGAEEPVERLFSSPGPGVGGWRSGKRKLRVSGDSGNMKRGTDS